MSNKERDRILRAIKPFVVGWINKGQGGGGYAPTPHEIAGIHHTGNLSPAFGDIVRIRGRTVSIYPGTNAGLARVNDIGATNDVILLPPKTFTADQVIADGVHICGWSRWVTVLTGEITGGAGASLGRLTVARSVSSSSAEAAILAPASGVFNIRDCDITMENTGTGAAYGLLNDVAGTIIKAWNAYLYGDAASGNGYGTFRDTGVACAIWVYGGHINGSTFPCNE